MMPRFSSRVVLSHFMQRASAALTLTLMLLLVTGIGHAAAFDIDQLMQGLAQIRTGQAGFVETKYIAMLDKPVESSGELFYKAPGRLEKRTLKPKPETMILDNGLLVIERGRQKHSLQVQDYPELAAIIDSIRGTLAGDRKALERNYRLSLEGGVERWTLQLLPVDEKMQAIIKRISITGAYHAVSGIEINRADGDRSLMLIEKLIAK